MTTRQQRQKRVNPLTADRAYSMCEIIIDSPDGRLVDLTDTHNRDVRTYESLTARVSDSATVHVYPIAPPTPVAHWERPWWVTPLIIACATVGLLLSLSAGGSGPLWLALPGIGLATTSLAVMRWAMSQEDRP